MNVLLDYLADNLLPILIAVGGGIAWHFDRKRRQAEIDGLKSTNKQSEATALQGTQDVYDRLVNHVKIQIDSLQEQIRRGDAKRDELRQRISELEDRSKEDALKIAELERENKELKRKLQEYETRLLKVKKGGE